MADNRRKAERLPDHPGAAAKLFRLRRTEKEMTRNCSEDVPAHVCNHQNSRPGVRLSTRVARFDSFPSPPTSLFSRPSLLRKHLKIPLRKANAGTDSKKDLLRNCSRARREPVRHATDDPFVPPLREHEPPTLG